MSSNEVMVGPKDLARGTVFSYLRPSRSIYDCIMQLDKRSNNLSQQTYPFACLIKHSKFRNLSSYIKEISFVQSLSAIMPKARRSAYNLAFKLKIVVQIYSHSISKELSVIACPKQKKNGWCKLVLR